MNQMRSTALHPDDGGLVRYLDRACEPDEHGAIAEHLAVCAACTGQIEVLSRRSAALSALLRVADPPVPAAVRSPRPARRFRLARWTGSWPLRIAATVTLLAATAAGVSPVRAWITERSRLLWTLITTGRPAAPDTPSQASIQADGSVSFQPATDVLVVQLAGRQAAGTLVIEGGLDSNASITVSGGSTGENLIVLPSGVRIVNSAASRATYQIRLSAGISQVLVEIGGEPAVRFQPIRPSDRWSVDLVR